MFTVSSITTVLVCYIWSAEFIAATGFSCFAHGYTAWWWGLGACVARKQLETQLQFGQEVSRELKTCVACVALFCTRAAQCVQGRLSLAWRAPQHGPWKGNSWPLEGFLSHLKIDGHSQVVLRATWKSISHTQKAARTDQGWRRLVTLGCATIG